jgi:hypothetical protein
MNKNYLCIDFKSNLNPDQMLARLRQEFPEARWHGSDTDTQGPSLSSLTKGKPQLKIFFEEGKSRFCVNFSPLGLHGSELDNYKDQFVTYVQRQVLPSLAA